MLSPSIENRIKKGSWAVLRAVLLLGMGYVILYPILVKMSLALRGREDLYDKSIIWFPKHPTFEHFFYVAEKIQYWEALANTLTLSAMTAILQTASCALVGYAFARLPYPGRGWMFSLVILTLIVPPQTVMIPTYIHYRYFDIFGIFEFIGGQPLNLLDTKWPFILQSLTANGLKNGLYVYIFRQFFRSLPNELEEAAVVDGCGVFQTFWRVMLPNAIPALITVIIFSFVWQYNDTFYVSMYLTDTKVLSLQLSSLAEILRGNNPEPALTSVRVNAGIVLVLLPIIIFYLILQRHFVEGVERSGIVG